MSYKILPVLILSFSTLLNNSAFAIWDGTISSDIVANENCITALTGHSGYAFKNPKDTKWAKNVTISSSRTEVFFHMDGALILNIKYSSLLGNKSASGDLQFITEDGVFAYFGKDSKVHIFSLEKDRQLAEFDPSDFGIENIKSISISDDRGFFAFSGTGNGNNHFVGVYNLKSKVDQGYIFGSVSPSNWTGSLSSWFKKRISNQNRFKAPVMVYISYAVSLRSEYSNIPVITKDNKLITRVSSNDSLLYYKFDLETGQTGPFLIGESSPMAILEKEKQALAKSKAIMFAQSQLNNLIKNVTDGEKLTNDYEIPKSTYDLILAYYAFNKYDESIENFSYLLANAKNTSKTDQERIANLVIAKTIVAEISFNKIQNLVDKYITHPSSSEFKTLCDILFLRHRSYYENSEKIIIDTEKSFEDLHVLLFNKIYEFYRIERISIVDKINFEIPELNDPEIIISKGPLSDKLFLKEYPVMSLIVPNVRLYVRDHWWLFSTMIQSSVRDNFVGTRQDQIARDLENLIDVEIRKLGTYIPGYDR